MFFRLETLELQARYAELASLYVFGRPSSRRGDVAAAPAEASVKRARNSVVATVVSTVVANAPSLPDTAWGVVAGFL